jgi:hypothetical protein
MKIFKTFSVILLILTTLHLHSADLGKTEECSRAHISPNAYTLLEDQIIENKNEQILTAKLFKSYQIALAIDSEYLAGDISESQKNELKNMLPH